MARTKNVIRNSSARSKDAKRFLGTGETAETIRARRDTLVAEIDDMFGTKDPRNAKWLKDRYDERMMTGGGSSLFDDVPTDPLRPQHVAAAIYVDMRVDGVEWKTEASSLDAFLGRYAPDYEPDDDDVPTQPIAPARKSFEVVARCDQCAGHRVMGLPVEQTCWYSEDGGETYSCKSCEILRSTKNTRTAREFIDGLSHKEMSRFMLARAALFK